jgi:hypothetical protein
MSERRQAIMESIPRTMRLAYARYLRSKRAKLSSGELGAFSHLTAEIMDAVGEDTAAQASVFAFGTARYRMDARAATVYAVASMLGREFPVDADNLLLGFLVEMAGLGEHPLRDNIEALANRVAQESDWGTQLYRFTEGVLALRDDDHEDR